ASYRPSRLAYADPEIADFRAAVLQVRIHFPPAESPVRTCLSREFAFLGREAGVFRGCAGRGERRGRQRRAERGNIGPTGGKYLCRAIFQYRAAGDVGCLIAAARDDRDSSVRDRRNMPEEKPRLRLSLRVAGGRLQCLVGKFAALSDGRLGLLRPAVE